MWILRTETDREDDGLVFRLMPGAIKTVGRATRADFILDAALVSRLHCRFTARESGELEIEDLRSTNGTFVNEVRVKRRAARARGLGEDRTGEAQSRSQMRNGFLIRSCPIIVRGPWPECTSTSSPSLKSTPRIDLISVS